MRQKVVIHVGWLRANIERDVLPRLYQADREDRATWARRMLGAAAGRRTLSNAAVRLMYLELYATVGLPCPLLPHHVLPIVSDGPGVHDTLFPGYAFDFPLHDPSAQARDQRRAAEALNRD